MQYSIVSKAGGTCVGAGAGAGNIAYMPVPVLLFAPAVIIVVVVVSTIRPSNPVNFLSELLPKLWWSWSEAAYWLRDSSC